MWTKIAMIVLFNGTLIDLQWYSVCVDGMGGGVNEMYMTTCRANYMLTYITCS